MKLKVLALILSFLTLSFVFSSNVFINPSLAASPDPLNPTGGHCNNDLDCRTNHNLTGCYRIAVLYFCTPTNIKNPYCDEKSDASGINTALGCIKVTSSQDIVSIVLKIAVSLGGGIALLIMLYGVFTITTSAGSPDKLKAGKEVITSAIIGLIFLILSVFLMNFIGIKLLGIPGLE